MKDKILVAKKIIIHELTSLENHTKLSSNVSSIYNIKPNHLNISN